MDGFSGLGPVSGKVSFIKRNCLLCKGRSLLRPVDVEQGNVRKSLNELAGLYQQKYDELRSADAEGALINRAIENKRYCMDLLDVCKGCDKEIDRVNRAIEKIKK